MDFRDFLKERLKNPGIKKKYDALELRYTIVGGVNGVGKTTFIRAHSDLSPSSGQVIDADQITARLGGNSLLGGKTAIKRIRESIHNRESFLQETTLSGYRTRATAKQVLKLGYNVHLIYIGLDTVEESLRRIENRVREGGHNVPTEDVIRRFLHRWEAVAQLLPYCKEAVFYDNTKDFVKVAEYRDGQLSIFDNHTCSWANELDAYLSKQWQKRNFG